jgi:hypothetical protein
MKKLKLYKDNIIKFIENNNLEIKNIEEIDYIIGILFLTEMNRYCKINKINIHGYYITYSLINLFIKIKNKLLNKNSIEITDITNFILYVSYNIDYLNSRVDLINPIRQKINNNFCKFIIEVNDILIHLIKYNKIHNIVYPEDNSKESKDDKNQNNTYCNIQCYICWVDYVLSKFFYLLLITAKFMGSGEIKKDPNLFKIAEYFSNIIYTYLKTNNNKLSLEIYSNLFNNYIDYKNKLYYSMFEMKINSETFDEIIMYLDKIITNFNINI